METGTSCGKGKALVGHALQHRHVRRASQLLKLEKSRSSMPSYRASLLYSPALSLWGPDTKHFCCLGHMPLWRLWSILDLHFSRM